jgi:hypothetical protein
MSVTADNVTLNLNGHTITYNTGTPGKATGGIVGIQTFESDWTHGYLNNATNTFAGTFKNFTVYGGSITQGGGTTSFNDSCAYPTPSSCATPVPSHPIRMGQNGSTFSGPTIYGVTFTFNCPSCLALQTDYGNSSNPGGPIFHDNAIYDTKDGANCSGPSGTTGCQQYRSIFAGNSANFTNAIAITNPAQIYNNKIYGGVQGGVFCDSLNCNIHDNNPIIPGSATLEYTNNFGIGLFNNGTVKNNVVGAAPPATNQFNRGIVFDCVESGTCTGGATVITGNTVTARGSTNNTEYSGCALGGAYAMQVDDGGNNASITNNTFTGYADNCPAIGLRVTVIGSNLTSSNNTYKAILTGLGSLVPDNLNPVAGISTDTIGSPAFVSTNDSFCGSQSTLSTYYDGSGEMDLINATMGDCGSPTSNYAAFSFGNGGGASTNINCIDCTFTGTASETSTDMQVIGVYAAAQYFIKHTYAGMAVGAVSGSPVSGAAVLVKGIAGNTECSTTTDSGGNFSCGPSNATALTKFDMKNSASVAKINTTHNNHTLTITKSGCTPYTNSSLNITAKSVGNIITLAGC